MSGKPRLHNGQKQQQRNISKNNMSSPVITTKPDEYLETAARYMLQNKVRYLLIINVANQHVGVITATDFIA